MSLHPLKDRIIAKKAAALTKTKTGILLGEAKESPAYAIVEAVGPEVHSLKKSDKIIFKEYSATEIKLDGETYLILEEKDILATLA